MASFRNILCITGVNFVIVILIVLFVRWLGAGKDATTLALYVYIMVGVIAHVIAINSTTPGERSKNLSGADIWSEKHVGAWWILRCVMLASVVLYFAWLGHPEGPFMLSGI